MTKLWIEWKTNGRFPTRSTVPWKSRKGGEIPTFPQLRRLLSHAQKTGDQKTEGCGRVEIQNQDSHFSTAPKACGARKVPGQHPFAPDATHTKQRGGQFLQIVVGLVDLGLDIESSQGIGWRALRKQRRGHKQSQARQMRGTASVRLHGFEFDGRGRRDRLAW